MVVVIYIVGTWVEHIMLNKRITINAILNVIRTGLSIIFPLITYPYVARILGKNGVGMVSYASSIVSYFVLFASFGISNYATREGAKIRNNRFSFQEFFEEIFGINLTCMLAAYLGLMGIILFSKGLQEYKGLLAILGIDILFKTLSVDWVNNVYEDFAYITVRSIITHVASLVVLLLLVRTPQDVYLYAIILVMTNAINCIMNFFYCRKYIRLRIHFQRKWKRHFSSLFYFFANDVTVSIYVNIDTTMLGYYKGDSAVGAYIIAVKIYSVVKRMLTAIYTVTLPQLAEFAERKSQEEYKKLYTYICAILSIVLIPSAVGLVALSEELILFMGGAEYKEAVLSLKILAFALIFAIYGGLVTVCFNITHKLEKINLYATFFSATLNFVINIFLIPKWGQYGAAFTTLLSEVFVFFFCFVKVKTKSDFWDMRYIRREIFNGLIGAILILCIAFSVHKILPACLSSFFIILFTSIFVYFGYLIIVRDDVVMKIWKRLETKCKNG